MLRKYIKRRVAHNPKLFEEAYQQMRDKSKKCYVATHCLGEGDKTLSELRNFKKVLSNSKVGIGIIDIYYHLSVRLLFRVSKYPKYNNALIFLLKPVLRIFAKVVKFFKIIK
tara:strand:+ start:74 stop:409 length:336 start_codon:yes stop_codon:yes gene_type:complete